MGQTTAKIELKNPRQPDLPPVTIDALADTGSDYLCIPRHIQRLLALEQAGTKWATLADGTSRAAPYVGPLQIRFGNRTGFAGAVVIGDQRDSSASSIKAICSSVTGSNSGITHRAPQEPPKPTSWSP